MSALASLLLVFVLPAMAGAVLLSGRSHVGCGQPAAGQPAAGQPAAGQPTAGQPTAGQVAPDALLARGVACGLATWLLGSGLLTRTVGLTSSSAWAWDGFVAAVSLVVLLSRNRVRLIELLRSAGRRLTEVAALTALVFVPLGYTIVHTSWSPLGSTPWYYFGLARQVADVGSIPATSIEFGTTTPFLNDYHLFTTGTAMLLLQHPSGPMTVTTTVTLVSVLLLGLGTVAVTSALGAGRLAALLAVPIALATGIGPIRLAAYRPEGFALGIALLLVALGIDWLRDRDPRSLVAAALLAATLSQVHGIASLTAGAMVAAAAISSLVGRPPLEQLRRTGIALVALLAAVVVAGLVFRETSGTVHAGGLVDRGGLADPTWEFFRAARGEATSMPPDNAALMRQSMSELYGWQLWWIVPALALACLGLWFQRRDAAARQVVSFTVLSVIGLLAIASVFMLGWHGYVPRRTGASRIVLEASLLGPPFLAIGLDCLARTAGAWGGRRVMRSPGVRRLGMLAALSVCGVVSLIRVADYYDGQAPTRDELATWRSMPMTSADVVLANGYTEGFIPDVTGAQGLLDGRAPYTFDAQLHRANRLLRGAQAFFADPTRRWDFLAEHDVSWVVVGDPDAFSLGTGNVWQTPRAVQALDGCAGLDRASSDGALTVFRVVDPGPRGC